MKILVVSLAGIGDTLLATPLIHELRVQFPHATLDALVLWSGSKDLLETNPHLDRVFQKNLIKEPKLESLRFLRTLRSERYHATLNTHPQSRIHYRIVSRLVGAPIRISHTYDCSGILDRFLVNRTRPQDYSKHTVANNLDLLELLGTAATLPHPNLEVSLAPSDTAWADAFLAQRQLAPRPLLGIHVGSGGTKNLKLKRWPLPHYIALVRRVNRELPNVAVLLFGGPEELPDHECIRTSSPDGTNLTVNSGNLRQAAALLQRCHAFLSVDTALMHLAAAVNTRGQIVIETPTLHTTNLPYGNPFIQVPNPIVAGRQLEYYRYDGHGIRGTHDELIRCMTAVRPEAVFEAVRQALQSPDSHFSNTTIAPAV